MRVSGPGAVAGAIAGGLARGAVVAFHVGEITPWLALPSAGIGALVGAIAGATGRPGKGALVGAGLSAILFALAIASGSRLLDLVGTLVGEERAGKPLMASSLPIFLQMAVAGGLGGAIGGWAGRAKDPQRAKTAADREMLG